MMKCIKYFFLVAVSLTMVTCKKYPEDPFISLHTAKKCLTREWKIKKILVNGNDQTNFHNDSLLNKDFSDLILNIGKDGELREFVGTLTGGDIERYDAFSLLMGRIKEV